MTENLIIQKGHPILQRVAREVSLDLIGGQTLNKEIERMRVALDSAYQGVALAAPQVGISRRLFIVSGRIFDSQGHHPGLVCINPVIIKKSQKTKLMEEGCLSLRYWYGHVRRSTHVTLSYRDQDGVQQRRGAGGLLAQIFQHELDHLNGILFDEQAEGLEELKGRDRQVFDQQQERYLASIHGE